MFVVLLLGSFVIGLMDRAWMGKRKWPSHCKTRKFRVFFFRLVMLRTGKLMKFEGLKVSLFLPPLGVLRGPGECDVHHRAEMENISKF